MNGMPRLEINRGYGAWGVFGDADTITVGQLLTEARRGIDGGPLAVVGAAPASMTQGSANLIGAHLRLAYWYGIAARYMQGRGIGERFGVDASTQAKGWAEWYYRKAQSEMAGRAHPATRLIGIGLGSPQEIQAEFNKGAKWIEGYVPDDTGAGLRGIAAILRAIGAKRVTASRQNVVTQSGQGGTSVTPSLPSLPSGPDLTPEWLEKLQRALKTAGIATAIGGGVLTLGLLYVAFRRK